MRLMDSKELKFFSLRSFMILLYIIAVAVIPLGLRMRLVEFFSPVETWHRLASKTTAEVFAQFRLELLVIVTLFIIIAALLKIYYENEKGTIANSYADYPVVAFAFLTVLSALFSPYINVAFWGYFDRAEGAFAYLCYLFIFIVAASLINADVDKKIILYAALAAGLLQSAIAVTQFFGFDILKTDLAMRLFIPPEYLSGVADVQFQFNYKAYGTTYNPNYLGGYMAMIFPIIFVKYLFTRSARDTIIWLVMLIISLAGFFAPTSMGAFIAAGMAIVIFLILSRNEFKNYYKKLLTVIAILVVVFFVSEALSGGMIMRKVGSFYKNTLETIHENRDRESVSESAALAPSQESSERSIAPKSVENEIVISRFPLDSFASNRGYIWRKSLEMMKKTILLGDGFDTFVYNFPHWDPGRDHEIYRIGILVDKPHNTYIQVALGAGVLGLIVYLYILALHLKKYLQVFRRRGLKEENDVIMMALFIGWLGYLFQGLSNDSVLSNAPVFWALFGLGVNYVRNALVTVEEKREEIDKFRKVGIRKQEPAKATKPGKKELQKQRAQKAGTKPANKSKKK